MNSKIKTTEYTMNTIIYIMNCACIDVELKDDSWESRGKGGYLDSYTTKYLQLKCI